MTGGRADHRCPGSWKHEACPLTERPPLFSKDHRSRTHTSYLLLDRNLSEYHDLHSERFYSQLLEPVSQKNLSECKWLMHLLRSPGISASGMAESSGSNDIIRTQSHFLHFSFLSSSEKALMSGWALIDLIGITCPFPNKPQ